MLEHSLQNIAIIGASGKMGRGIALLILQEMTLSMEENKTTANLTLIDTSQEGLDTLKPYLRIHLRKFAEKKVNSLREIYKDVPSLISNEEMINHFITRALDAVNCTTRLESAEKAHLVFEAIVENTEAKTEVFKTLKRLCSEKTFIFSNTSSIPISELRDKAGLDGKIIGYHFYNPPSVQKLLEIIPPEGVDPNLKKLAEDLGKKLNKTIVYSNDIAGFIGNGHCIPEALYAFNKAQELSSDLGIPLYQAIYIINEVTEKYLIRPMGIFQLIDYVGIDVCHKITLIMGKHLNKSTFKNPLLEKMLTLGVLGGQYPDGTQKDGFFHYKGMTIEGYYDTTSNDYKPFKESDWRKACHERLGQLPKGHASWKNLLKDPQREEKLEFYFKELFNGNSFGEKLAQEYLMHSISIAEDLVKNGVAHTLDDVSTVLKTGFFHLYGPNAAFLRDLKKGVKL